MANNWQLGMIAGLDGTQSRNQLNSDIKGLSRHLDKLKLYTEIDKNQVIQLQNQLKKLQIDLNTVTVSDAAINGLVQKINAGLQNIQISNINIGNIGNQAQQVGNNIGQQVSQSISSAIQKGTMSNLKEFKFDGKLLQNDVAKKALEDFKALGQGVVTVKEEMKNIDGKTLLNGFTINIKNAKGEVESLRYALRDIEGKTGQSFQYTGGSINDNGVIKQMNAISAKADSLQTKLDKLKANYLDTNASRPIKDANNISALSQQYDNVTKSIENVRNADNSTFSSMVSNAQKEITTLETMVSQFRNAENVATQMKSVDISSGIAQAQERLGKLKANASGFEQMKQTIVDLDTAIAKVGDKSSLDAFINKLKVAESQLGRVKAEARTMATEQQRLSLANTIEAWNQKNTRATKAVREENERYVVSLRDLNNQMTKIDFNKINTGFKQNENSMRALNRLGASLKDQMKQAANSFTQWISVSSAIMGVVYSTKEAVQELKEVDNILTEISKTSDMTSQELEKLGMSSYSSASKYGRTATDYLTGVQEMSRSGFYGEKGTAMAEQSLLAQSAGDMTSELANSYILATNAAYKFNGEASKINAVLDGQNSITNKNSVAMADMATAMTKAGTVASSYNVSIEDLSAMIGTMESVTKLGGEEVGTGIKSILINLQNISSSKITGTLDKANASMTEMKNGIEQLRNPIVILRDLAKTFNDLDEKDPLRAEILTNIGGKYQATKLAALLQNMEMFDKMLVDYSQGSGSAMEEASKSANNLQGRLNALSNSWTEFVNTIVKSDALKDGVNLLNGLVQGVTKLTSSLGSLGTIGLGAGIFAGVKNIGKHIRAYGFKLNCFEYALHA